MKPGDTLVIKSIDRLGRDFDEILQQWRHITKEIHADVVVLDMPLLDTRQGKDLTGILIADLVLQILSYVAQKEREFIHQRQAEGIAAAKARGVSFGRPPIIPPDAFEDVLKKWRDGEVSARRAAEMLGVTHVTFLKGQNLADNKKYTIITSGLLRWYVKYDILKDNEKLSMLWSRIPRNAGNNCVLLFPAKTLTNLQ